MDIEVFDLDGNTAKKTIYRYYQYMQTVKARPQDECLPFPKEGFFIIATVVN
jgi:hypothetical protein